MNLGSIACNRNILCGTALSLCPHVSVTCRRAMNAWPPKRAQSETAAVDRDSGRTTRLRSLWLDLGSVGEDILAPRAVRQDRHQPRSWRPLADDGEKGAPLANSANLAIRVGATVKLWTRPSKSFLELSMSHFSYFHLLSGCLSGSVLHGASTQC